MSGQIWETAGKVRMIPKGAYNSNIEYEPLDMVSDENSLKYYIAKQKVLPGIELSNEEYWCIVADVSQLRGPEGPMGPVGPAAPINGNYSIEEENITGTEDYEINFTEQPINTAQPIITVGGRTADSNGNINLNSNDIIYNSSLNYSDNTIGKFLHDLNSDNIVYSPNEEYSENTIGKVVQELADDTGWISITSNDIETYNNNKEVSEKFNISLPNGAVLKIRIKNNIVYIVGSNITIDETYRFPDTGIYVVNILPTAILENINEEKFKDIEIAPINTYYAMVEYPIRYLFSNENFPYIQINGTARGNDTKCYISGFNGSKNLSGVCFYFSYPLD